MLFLLSAPVWGSSRLTRAKGTYPEEAFRAEWDRGCSDWASFLPETENVGIRFERSEDRYWLWGHARVKPERGETLATLLASTRAHLSDSSNFLAWVLPGINEHPRKNSSYFVDLESLKLHSRGVDHVHLTGPFVFRVPGLKLRGFSTIELKWEDRTLGQCPIIQKLDPALRVWSFRMFPRPDVLQWMVGEMAVVASENGRDAIIKIRLALKPSTLVYRLLPAKLIENELRFRAQRVLGNFVEFRRTKIWNSGEASRDDSPSRTVGASSIAAFGSRKVPVATRDGETSR